MPIYVSIYPTIQKIELNTQMCFTKAASNDLSFFSSIYTREKRLIGLICITDIQRTLFL